MNTHLLEVVNLDINYAVGQTELGDTIFQHASDFVESLEYIYIKAQFCHVACKAQSRRTGTDGSHLDTVGRCNLRQ